MESGRPRKSTTRQPATTPAATERSCHAHPDSTSPRRPRRLRSPHRPAHCQRGGSERARLLCRRRQVPDRRHPHRAFRHRSARLVLGHHLQLRLGQPSVATSAPGYRDFNGGRWMVHALAFPDGYAAVLASSDVNHNGVIDTTAEVTHALSTGDAVDQGVVKYFVCTVNKVPASR